MLPLCTNICVLICVIVVFRKKKTMNGKQAPICSSGCPFRFINSGLRATRRFQIIWPKRFSISRYNWPPFSQHVICDSEFQVLDNMWTYFPVEKKYARAKFIMASITLHVREVLWNWKLAYEMTKAYIRIGCPHSGCFCCCYSIRRWWKLWHSNRSCASSLSFSFVIYVGICCVCSGMLRQIVLCCCWQRNCRLSHSRKRHSRSPVELANLPLVGTHLFFGTKKKSWALFYHGRITAARRSEQQICFFFRKLRWIGSFHHSPASMRRIHMQIELSGPKSVRRMSLTYIAHRFLSFFNYSMRICSIVMRTRAARKIHSHESSLNVIHFEWYIICSFGRVRIQFCQTWADCIHITKSPFVTGAYFSLFFLSPFLSLSLTLFCLF